MMSVIITFMFEPAKLQMNWARASGAMNRRGEPTQSAARSFGASRAELSVTASTRYVTPPLVDLRDETNAR
jgi:hypothetical protein